MTTYANRRENLDTQERIVLTYDNASISASLTVKLYKAATGKYFHIDRVTYINPTGLASDNTNAFSLTVNNGATVMATVFNTDGNDVPAGAALAADTFVEGAVIAAAAALAPADIMSLVFTKDGTQTLPVGRVTIEGRLL